jgi:hypothetical protein
MPLCEYCGEREVVDGDVACKVCIAHFAEEDRNHTCLVVDCENVIPYGHMVCEECGKKLQSATLNP